jgi:hypothetical protein
MSISSKASRTSWPVSSARDLACRSHMAGSEKVCARSTRYPNAHEQAPDLACPHPRHVHIPGERPSDLLDRLDGFLRCRTISVAVIRSDGSLQGVVSLSARIT